MAKESQQLVMAQFPPDLLNCRQNIGWLKHAFVLSFYYLKRFESYFNANKVDQFYHDCIR